jgi:hypothetical protein
MSGRHGEIPNQTEFGDDELGRRKLSGHAFEFGEFDDEPNSATMILGGSP